MIEVNVTQQRNGIKVSIGGKHVMLETSADVAALKHGVRLTCAALINKLTKMQEDV